MSRQRQLAALAGGLYLVTFATSIPALVLKGPVLDDPRFVLDTADTSSLAWAGALELLLALACIGTAAVLFPVVRRQSQVAATGFLASRVLEASLIVVGMIGLLAVASLGHDAAGLANAEDQSLMVTAAAMVAVHDWAFLLGPGFLPAVNAVFLGAALLRSGLVPRAIPLVGLVGAPLLAASACAALFGITEQVSATSLLLALPIATWELSLGVWLVVRGFRPTSGAQFAAA